MHESVVSQQHRTPEVGAQGLTHADTCSPERLEELVLVHEFSRECRCGRVRSGAMLELLVGGALGLLVAVVTQLMARGGRLKGLRSTIREELELVRLLDSHNDSLKEKLELQVRVHLLEYLNDPDLNGVVGKVRTMLFAIIWASIGVSGAVTLAVFDPALPWLEPSLRSWLVGIFIGLASGFAVMVLSHVSAKRLVRSRFSSGLLMQSREQLRQRREAAAAAEHEA